MTASTSMSTFCQWLLNEPESKAATSAIVLHGDPGVVNDRLINEISQYLNEYDDDADGLWLNATAELVERIAKDPSSRSLLGMDDLEPGQIAGREEEVVHTLEILSRRGHLVFKSPTGGDESLQSARCFHAGVGPAKEIGSTCHITIDPALISPKCIPSIIADVFLEWAHCDGRGSHEGKGIQKIR